MAEIKKAIPIVQEKKGNINKTKKDENAKAKAAWDEDNNNNNVTPKQITNVQIKGNKQVLQNKNQVVNDKIPSQDKPSEKAKAAWDELQVGAMMDKEGDGAASGLGSMDMAASSVRCVLVGPSSDRGHTGKATYGR